MDLSRFSDGDLQAIRDGDYSKISNKGLVELKVQHSIGMVDTHEKGLVPENPLETVGNALDTAGEATADKLGSAGHPILGAAAGTAIKMAPDLLLAGQGVAKAPEVAEALGDFIEPVKTALTPGGLRELGAAIGQTEAGAGIEQTVPTIKDFAKKIGLPKGKQTFTDIVNEVRAQTGPGGFGLTPQGMADFDELVKQQYALEKIPRGTKLDSITASTAQQVRSGLNDAVSGRGALAQQYGQVKRVQNVIKRGAQAAAVGAGGYLVKKAIQGSLGGQ